MMPSFAVSHNASHSRRRANSHSSSQSLGDESMSLSNLLSKLMQVGSQIALFTLLWFLSLFVYDLFF